MTASPLVLRRLRDGLAVVVVGIFTFPIFWWALTSIKPLDALYDRGRVVVFDFIPTWGNYAVVLFGEGPGSFDSRQTIADTFVVALGASALTLAIALPAGFALSLLTFGSKRAFFLWIVFHRILPPIAVILPLMFIYQSVGLIDTRAGVILAHAAANLPFAVLLLKSFFDDVPREVAEAAMIDGASRVQIFTRIFTPMIRGGIAAALSTAALVPSIVFIFLVQKHLVRGLTMGLTKG